ncbi:unnamed protein product [Cyclocybe aegerita]|uniref:EthD domain-containing protein n=1 Tax=Cyclocybe aegerita TaxID=1973307 RepID=A0A8S0X0J5_CYCAE|nr:unnamed protein product [Cyclocybe aegerita]
MPRGFLTVTFHPSSLLPEVELREKYEGEHISLHEFLSGARYRTVDFSDSMPYGSTHPEWLAIYEINDTATFSKPAYMSLREQTFAFGQELGEGWTREEVEVLLTGTDSTGEGERRPTGMKPVNRSEWVVTHGLGVGEKAEDEGVRNWAEDVITGLGQQARVHPEGKGVPPYLVVYEYLQNASTKQACGR